MEASGTGNMKLALNGALTIGTLDGANIEIRERVGAENIFIFGLTAEEVDERRARRASTRRRRSPRRPRSREVLDALESGVFSPDDRSRYRGLVDDLRHHDYFMVTADFDAYCATQRAVDALLARSATRGGARRSSTPRGWAGSRPTARSASTRARSGA